MACLFVEELTVLDFSRLDRERGLVGESWIVDLELAGALDEQSMVLDFGEVKRVARQALEDHADHKLLVPVGGDVRIADRQGAREILFPWGGGRLIRVLSPETAFTFLPGRSIDMEALRPRLVEAVRAVVPPSIERIGVELREEDRPGHYYHYSHGLKRHAGQCQRIAHGHRSRIEIRADGVRDEGRERAWADRWRDIYLGSREDVTGETTDGHETRVEFAYDAPEGRFELSIGQDRCEIIPTDSTVECLAAYAASQLGLASPDTRIEVRAYEGINKGAVAAA